LRLKSNKKFVNKSKNWRDKRQLSYKDCRKKRDLLWKKKDKIWSGLSNRKKKNNKDFLNKKKNNVFVTSKPKADATKKKKSELIFSRKEKNKRN
jgi:hypothetical protein